jgi:hypothetical protein
VRHGKVEIRQSKHWAYTMGEIPRMLERAGLARPGNVWLARLPTLRENRSHGENLVRTRKAGQTKPTSLRAVATKGERLSRKRVFLKSPDCTPGSLRGGEATGRPTVMADQLTVLRPDTSQSALQSCRTSCPQTAPSCRRLFAPPLSLALALIFSYRSPVLKEFSPI